VPPSPQPPNRVITPREFPAFEGRVELRCQACGKKAKYTVGRIFVDPQPLRDAGKQQPKYEDMVSFTGYFHCRCCGAGGPWEFPPRTVMQLQLLMLMASQNPAKADVQFLRAKLFDGTFIRTATEAEAHLRKLIEANPSDDFLWSRLGNLYDQAEEEELAFTAFSRAVELNPHDVESHYSLGCYLMGRKQAVKAAEHFTQVLRHCRTAPRRQPGLLESIVQDTLERLWELHLESKGAIEFLPLFEPPPLPEGETGPRQVVVKELDLGNKQTWEALTTMYLTSRFPGVASARTAPGRLPPQPDRPAAGPSVRVGQNQPCPCGSGKKFKHCCGHR
jgi:tetratricopeptide (TPR) repeat protein